MGMSRFLLLCLFWLNGLLLATNIPVELKKSVDEFLKITSFQAKIKQTNFVEMTESEEEYLGKIYFDKSRLLIKYSLPELQVVSCDKTKTVVYLQASNQKIISSPTLIFWPNRMVSKFLEGAKNFSKRESSQSFFYEFTPDLQSNENVKKIEVGVKKGQIFFLKYYDFEGNFASYEFSDFQYGQILDSSVFDVEYPENVEVIDNR